MEYAKFIRGVSRLNIEGDIKYKALLVKRQKRRIDVKFKTLPVEIIEIPFPERRP
jgi:hypothetical protein